MPVITCIDDLKRMHRARTPKMFYDYAESGSYTEQTFRDNTTDFARLKLRQKVAVDMSDRRLSRQMAGQAVTMPVALAPVGMTGMQHADGEIHAARAAEKFGVPFCLSTMSICSIEDVAAHTTAPFMFQLYVMKDQDFVAAIIERAKAANCSALVLTLDLQILGQRHKDLKNGLSAPPKMTLPTMLDLSTRWRWGMGMLKTKRRFFGNIVGHAKGVGDTSSLMSWTAEQFDERLDWDKIARIRDMWGGKLILKGILDPEDARMAADFGADAIIVSNHGGRQLDGALSSIRMLPHIVKAVGDRVEVHMDSGIRSGQDVLKALALGAHGTWIGRAWLHGLGAMGEVGVTRALEIIRKELDISMALCGERDLDNIGLEHLLIPRDFLDEYQIGQPA
ncbi:L-lactate dehydrogenase [Paracoccus marcusii]|uniref:alpha-hydroxy acid oxidase n=1 Tax=Paracoccus marcusii TaxID=59779 RepID=UPI0038B71106